MLCGVVQVDAAHVMPRRLASHLRTFDVLTTDVMKERSAASA
jgi:hypothetical protein